MVVGDPERPTAVRRRTRNADVTAERDEHAAADRLRDSSGSAIGSERLRGRAEIELAHPGSTDRVAVLVEHDRTPAGNRRERRSQPAPVPQPDLSERPVVARQPERPAHRRVDQTVREARDVERDLDRLKEKSTDPHVCPCVAIQDRQLRIGPEPAAGTVELREIVPQHRLGEIEISLVRHRDDCRGPERVERSGLDHDAPETAAGGCWVDDGSCDGGEIDCDREGADSPGASKLGAARALGTTTPVLAGDAAAPADAVLWVDPCAT